MFTVVLDGLTIEAHALEINPAPADGAEVAIHLTLSGGAGDHINFSESVAIRFDHAGQDWVGESMQLVGRIYGPGDKRNCTFFGRVRAR